MRLLRRFWDDRGANIAVLFAMGFSVSAMVAAIAVDGAALYNERRSMQNGVDLAALSAAGNATQAKALAQESLVDAGLLSVGSTTGLTVVTGNYDANPALAAKDRFKPNKTPINAVSVYYERPGQLYFARGWAPQPKISTVAIASVTPQVSFSIGSRLANLNGGIANVVLNKLLGTKVGLTVMDYQSLLNVNVDAFRFLDALALKLGVTAGTYDDLLNMRADHGVLAGALATLVTGAERTALNKLAGSAGNNGTLPLNKLFNLGALGKLSIGSRTGEDLFTKISAIEMLSASAALSNGNRQVDLAIGASVPGLIGADVELAIGEPPQGGAWYAIGPNGTVVRTAQLRLRIEASVLGSGALLGIPVNLPLFLEMAHAEAIVGAATCPTRSAPSGSATILARPGVVRVMVGEVTPGSFGAFNTPPKVGIATLVEVKVLFITVLKVLASAMVEIAQTTPVPLSFSSSDIAANAIKTARTSTVVSSLTGSLLDNLTLEVPILGLGLNLTSLRVLLKAILSPIAPVLDLTIARVLEALGLSIGEVDVRVYGVRCTSPVLVG
ncbi:TadG family pilus assembly protein [Devosia sp. 2618]|uniref:TadG family pilus assembly protein n=1 Tax=Devosia sp. 2618 TaxID=3156454 RepID=UPI00339683DD